MRGIYKNQVPNEPKKNKIKKETEGNKTQYITPQGYQVVRNVVSTGKNQHFFCCSRVNFIPG